MKILHLRNFNTVIFMYRVLIIALTLELQIKILSVNILNKLFFIIYRIHVVANKLKFVIFNLQAIIYKLQVVSILGKPYFQETNCN